MIDKRIAECRRVIGEKVSNLTQLRRVIDCAMERCKFVPAPAELAEFADALDPKDYKIWVSPEKPLETVETILEDIAFQRQFAIDRPRHARDCAERIAELEAKLAEMQVPK